MLTINQANLGNLVSLLTIKCNQVNLDNHLNQDNPVSQASQ